ncbi:hypothetical protein D9613_000415 [Agrocybe pediades]|uniref:Ribonuclease H2 subunit B n=1 Tax=Agrocybe pediades TaxID=84607 RepID=A0A8H4R1M2_9AGAR|nr:hypothetical protein D9613_000415 [Agrocybe pediades]
MSQTSHFSILPSDILQYLSASLDASIKVNDEPLRILRLPHPRTALPSLFLPLEYLPSSSSHHTSTILEIQSVSPPDERSWILGEDVIADGKLLTMTSIDPAFLLIPILQALEQGNEAAGQFRPADDLLDEAAKRLAGSDETQAQDLSDFCALKCSHKALPRICDFKEISSDITVYRYSLSKTLEYMRSKVAHLQKSTALENSLTITRILAKDGLMEDGKDELLQLGRIRACCDLISQYLDPITYEKLLNSYDLSKLQKYVDANKAEAVAKAVVAAPKTKSTATNDKKRKPAKPSRGVGELKKVNTTGMAKLSSFFSKA